MSPAQIDALPIWISMCAVNREFVENFNRLSGSSITFTPPKRTAFEALIDATCNHTPTPQNNDAEMWKFWQFCLDAFERIPFPEATA